MALTVRITDEQRQDSTVRIVEVDTGTEDISDPASFVGDVLHFAGVGTPQEITVEAAEHPAPPVMRASATLVPRRESASESDGRCARRSCGHARGHHGNLDDAGADQGEGGGACLVCTEPNLCRAFAAGIPRLVTQ